MELAAFELWLRIYLCTINTNFFCSVLTCGSFDSDLVLCHIGFFDCPRCLEQQLREVPGTRISTGIARTGIDYPLSADKHLELPLPSVSPNLPKSTGTSQKLKYEENKDVKVC